MAKLADQLGITWDRLSRIRRDIYDDVTTSLDDPVDRNANIPETEILLPIRKPPDNQDVPSRLPGPDGTTRIRAKRIPYPANTRCETEYYILDAERAAEFVDAGVRCANSIWRCSQPERPSASQTDDLLHAFWFLDDHWYLIYGTVCTFTRRLLWPAGNVNYDVSLLPGVELVVGHRKHGNYIELGLHTVSAVKHLLLGVYATSPLFVDEFVDTRNDQAIFNPDHFISTLLNGTKRVRESLLKYDENSYLDWYHKLRGERVSVQREWAGRYTQAPSGIPLTDQPDENGYVNKPLDSSSYMPASEIISKYSDGLPVTITAKMLGETVEKYTANHIRWTRPMSKSGEPHPKRRNVHLGDWLSYIKRYSQQNGDHGWDDPDERELETRKISILKKRPARK